MENAGENKPNSQTVHEKAPNPFIVNDLKPFLVDIYPLLSFTSCLYTILIKKMFKMLDFLTQFLATT